MKRLFAILFILISSNAFCQSQNLIKSANQHVKFIYDTTTTAFLELPSYLSYIKFNSEGEIHDVNDDLIATINSEKEIFDANNDRIGKYNSSWIVFDVNDHIIGSISEDGRILDAQNFAIGFYTGLIPKQYLVYYYFFYDIL